ncbi:UDP-4-amino-4,6-dideoxy-N-acetyl-beta-L-altrosamine N-acetyltransferase [Enterovibrio calviensis]|uniref:UDP-4-amino-4, 6-dideoxy-N-acetyl-beta-L-altrosamine N-acetyltransferase n=1 Tax=Enterovibrio calviensis TaxID=91359 RepID=UPI0037366044
MSEMTPCDNTKTTLRPMTEADLAMVREWRNDPAVRQFMFTQHDINAEEHRCWFTGIADDQTKRFLIALIDETPIGMVSFTHIDATSGSAEWGFYKDPGSPTGTGIHLLQAALVYGFTDLALRQIDSRVLCTNSKVLHLHHKLSFRQDESVAVLQNNCGDAIPYCVFHLSREQWTRSVNHLTEY